MFKRSKISMGVLLALGGVFAMPAVAQDATQRVEITGSSIKRINAETALPVTIIKVDDLVSQGVTTAEQAMARFASNQSSFGISQSIGATTGGKAEADLRGLGGPTGNNANKTLVLLNGRRLANHAFDAAAVDLNAIPLAAVDRIEVLRDGASAIYGTDAIGGVINFILKRDFTGLEVSASAQQPEKSGGGDTQRFTATGGFGSLAQQRFNVLASIDYRTQSVLPAEKRKFAATGVLGPSRSDLTSGTSGTAFPGDLSGFEPTGPNCVPPKSLPRNTNPDNTGAFQTCRYDFTRDIDIITDNEQVTGLLRGTFLLTPDHTLSAEYLNANNKGTARVAPAPVSHVMPATSPFFPVGAPVGDTPQFNLGDGSSVGGAPGGIVNWRQVPAGKRTSGDNTTTERAMLELAGTFSGMDYRSAVGQSRNKSIASVKRGYVNDDLMQRGVWDGIINPFGDQTAAGVAAIEAAQVVADTLIGTNRVDFVDFRLNADLGRLSAGPVSAAFGAEHRREKSSFEATDITAVLGSLGIDPDSDTAGKRNSSALFAEVNFPLLKTLDLTVAGRYDKYSDFGNTFNPKVSVRFQPMPEVLIRGSANKGFRAPTLYDIYQPRSLTFTSDNYDDPLLCPGGIPVPGASAGVVCGQQVLQRSSGPVGIGQPASALQPEKSNTFTVGMVFQPSTSVTFGFDIWSIKVKNLISGLQEQAIFGDPTKYASRFFRCSQVSAAERATIDTCLNFPNFDPIAYIDAPTENLGELHTSGVDVSASWHSAATPFGRFGAIFEGTYVDEYKFQRERGGEYINAVGIYADNGPVFRWQHVLSGSWSSGPWSGLLSQRYKSGYVDQDGTSNVASYTLYDLAVTWTGVKNLSLTAGINNLLDQDPPKSVQNTTFQRGYDPRFTDPLGRTFMLRASYKFF